MVTPSVFMRLVGDRQPIEQTTVESVDPVELGRAVVLMLGWPVVPGAAALLHRDQSSDAEGPHQQPSTPGRVSSVSPAAFTRAVLDDDQRVPELASGVDVVALAWFGITVSSWPQLSDPRPWLDRFEVAQLDPDLGPTGG